MSFFRSLFSMGGGGGGGGASGASGVKPAPSRREAKLHTKLETKYGLESGGCSR